MDAYMGKDGKVHYNRWQNKGWGEVSQFKKTRSVSHSGKRKGYVPVFGEERYVIQKTERELFVATRLGSMQLGERIHICPSKIVGGYSKSTLVMLCWTIAGRVVTMLIIKRKLHVRDYKKGVRRRIQVLGLGVQGPGGGNGEGGLRPLPRRSCDLAI